MEAKHHDYLCKRLLDLQTEDKYTDFIIETEDGDKIPCHRVIMAAASPFFDTMFNNEMKETLSGMVQLPFPSETVELILKYVYKGDNIIASKTVTVPSVYYAANYLQISPLVEDCEQFLKTGMDTSISLEIWQISKLFGNHAVTEIAKTIVLNSFSSFCNVDGMSNVDSSRFRHLLQEPFLNCSGTLKCKAAWIWLVVHGIVDKTQVEEMLLALISADNVDNDDIINACRNDIDELLGTSDIEKIEQLQLLWDQAREKHWIKPMSDTHSVPRVRNEEECFVVVGGDQRGENKITAFSFKKKMWYDLKASPRDLGHRYAVCSVGSKLYLSGGTSGKQRDFLCFNGYNKHWSNLQEMPIGREQHSMCSVDQRIYVLGGTSKESEKVWDVHMYKDNHWIKCGGVAYPVAAATSTQIGSKIFLLGGSVPDNPRAPSDIAQCYDTKTNYSMRLTYSMPFKSKIQTMAATAVHDVIYLIHKGEIFVLKEKTKAESVCKVENAPCKGFAVTAFGNKILILGGEDDNFKMISSIMQVDTTSRQAVTLPSCTPWAIKDFAHAKLNVHLAWDMDELLYKRV